MKVSKSNENNAKKVLAAARKYDLHYCQRTTASGDCRLRPAGGRTEFKESLSHLKFLDLLLGQQAAARRDRSVERRIREAQFEERKLLETFDWKFNPQIDRPQIEEPRPPSASSFFLISRAKNRSIQV